jgi:hypothetical protein
VTVLCEEGFHRLPGLDIAEFSGGRGITDEGVERTGLVITPFPVCVESPEVLPAVLALLSDEALLLEKVDEVIALVVGRELGLQSLLLLIYQRLSLSSGSPPLSR